MSIRTVLHVAIGLGATFSVLTAAIAATTGAPAIRVVTRPLTITGAAPPDQARPLISVTAARLVVNGLPSGTTQPSEPIKTTTRTLVINGRSDKR
jgi:hypothetical protein